MVFAWTLVFETSGRRLPEFEKDIAERVEAFSEKVPAVASSLDTIRIRITYTREEFGVATRGLVPDWSIGAANPETGTIVLYFPESSRSPQAIELVGHELGHILLHNAVGEGVWIPRWFDEGFAQWISGPIEDGQAVRIAYAELIGESVRLWELESVNSWSGDRANLAYAESRAAFDFLMEIAPNSDIFALINSLGRDRDFDIGFEAHMGISVEDFYLRWAEERVHRFNWSLILLDWRFIFSAITILFLIGGTIKLVRTRRIIRERDGEEIQA